MPKKIRVGTESESKGTEEGRRQTEIHPHIHEVKYRDKAGNIRDYQYNYGKIATKSHSLRKLKER